MSTSQTDTNGAMDPQATHPMTHTQKGNALKDLTNTIHQSVSEDSPVHISTSNVTTQPDSSSNGGASSSSSASIPNLKPSHIVIEMEPSQTHGIKTSLGASLVKVIGYDNTVHEFDDLRSNLKQLKREKADKKKEVIQRYKHLSSLSARVLAKRTQLDAHIRDLEHQHFISHGRVPDRDNESYAHSLSQRNSAKAVLRNLNVDL